MENFGKLSPSQQNAILASQPGATPPNGTVPNFDNPPTHNDAGVAILTICVFLVTISAFLRLYSRVFVIRVFKLEDYLGFASYLPFLGLVAMHILLMRRVGFIVDQWNITLGAYLDFILYLFIYRHIYALVMIFAKTAILLEWSSILVPFGTRTWFFWTSRTMVAINVVAYVSFLVEVLLSCIPTQKTWKPWIDGTCFGRGGGDTATAWINLTIDTAILLLPQPIIWKLNMTRERKIGVSFIFSIGFLVITCATGRIHSNMTMDYGNMSHDGAVNTIWAFGEAAGVIMVFSAPGIPKAFTDQSFLAGALSALRSWTRLHDATTGRSQKIGGGSWPPTIARGARKSPRKPGATEISLVETYNSDYLELESNPLATVSTSRVPKIGILKTTTLESREDSASNTSTEPIMEHQHPWLGK
ncbi:hypothetical protein F4677DRAFT_460331 [Hypoxylon crocopeplum]|nr:hypothetical protein F4677DRAFT_460331 [Hypoxylon crocopeplum]